MDNLYSSFYLYRKYEIIGDELIDLGITSVDGEGTQEPVMKEECDPACGCPEPPVGPIYRWIQTENTVCVEDPQIQYRWAEKGTTCIGYDKYQNNIKEQSSDGVIWTVIPPAVYSASPLVESASTDCGCFPSTPPFDGKYKLVLSDSSIVYGECDSTSAVTSGDTTTHEKRAAVSIEIGNCVTTIDAYAFSGCTNIESLRIPHNVTDINMRGFYRCSSLKNIALESGIKNIGYAAFENCYSLESIVIPNSVITIDDWAFGSCSRLVSVTCLAEVPPALGASALMDATGNRNLLIYVPVSSLDDYKSANRWSQLADRIFPIPN